MTIKCDGCDGSGVRAPASPSCNLPINNSHVIVVERCDACQRFDNDMQAAQSMYDVANWITCSNGGSHVIANVRTLRACAV